MYAASQVPSGVLISPFVSVTGNSAAAADPVAATKPAATEIATKSRRERSPEGSVFSLWSGFSSVMTFSPCYSQTADMPNFADENLSRPDGQRNEESSNRTVNTP